MAAPLRSIRAHDFEWEQLKAIANEGGVSVNELLLSSVQAQHPQFRRLPREEGGFQDPLRAEYNDYLSYLAAPGVYDACADDDGDYTFEAWLKRKQEREK